MHARRLAAVLATATLALGTVLVAAPAQAAGPIAGCKLMTAAQATKVLGAKATVKHQTNKATPKGPIIVLNRGCTWHSAKGDFGYTANIYMTASIATLFYNGAAANTAKAPHLVLKKNVTVAKQHGFLRVYYFPTAKGKKYMDQIEVRKGRTLFITNVASATNDKGAKALLAAADVVPHM